jgi:hypothetical protein
MKLEFIEASHTYLVDGEAFPSVTQVLHDQGFVDATWFTDYGRDRGTMAHKCFHLDDMNDLDDASVDPVLMPYLSAYRRFKQESGFVPSDSEVQLASMVYRFAGTLDKVGSFGDGICAIIDCKTGPILPFVAIQTAAYEILKGAPYRRFALQLKADGAYKLHQFTDRNDKAVFLAALSVFHWRKANLLRKEKTP